jgi:streptomycin 3"-adenylyltransferase
MIQLTAIADAISKALRDNFLGFYIMGSFVMGDWDPQKSDIDFIVVTRKPLNKENPSRSANCTNLFPNQMWGRN